MNKDIVFVCLVKPCFLTSNSHNGFYSVIFEHFTYNETMSSQRISMCANEQNVPEEDRF